MSPVNTAITSTDTSDPRPRDVRKRGLRRWVFVALLITAVVPLVRVTLLPPAAGFDGYNYSSYRQVPSDLPGPQGLNPGDFMPGELTVFDVGGQAVPLQSLWAEQPLVLEFGSVSCPIFHGNGRSMEEIFGRYDQGAAARARVGMLYVREAHPGWLRSPHQALDDKLANANVLHGKLSRPIWIDTIDGELHQAMGPEPNSVFIIDTSGRIIYKSVWNAPAEVERVLDNMLNHGVAPRADESNYCTDPRPYYARSDYIKYLGRIALVGGPDALLDFMINLVMRSDGDVDQGDACNVRL